MRMNIALHPYFLVDAPVGEETKKEIQACIYT